MTVFRIAFKQHIAGIIGWTVVISAMTGLLIFLHTLFAGSFSPDAFAARVNALPALVRGILGLSAVPDLSHDFQFTAYIYQFILLFAGIYAGILGAKSLSGEEGRGTIEFIYSLPITRGSILRQKTVSCVISYILFSVLVYAATCVIIWVFNREMNISGIVIQLFRVYLCLLFIGLVYLSIGILVSALFRSNAESISVILAIVLITYIVGMMGNIMPHLNFLIYFSPVHAVLPLTTLNDGFNYIGLAVFVVFLILANLRYKKKDFYV